MKTPTIINYCTIIINGDKTLSLHIVFFTILRPLQQSSTNFCKFDNREETGYNHRDDILDDDEEDDDDHIPELLERSSLDCNSDSDSDSDSDSNEEEEESDGESEDKTGVESDDELPELLDC
eukprot:scaffold348314_cov24-Attheya_sp.AAC.1